MSPPTDSTYGHFVMGGGVEMRQKIYATLFLSQFLVKSSTAVSTAKGGHLR